MRQHLPMPKTTVAPDFAVSPEQVLGYRMARHHLTDATAAKPAQLVRVVTDTLGIQSQVNSSAELAVSVRIPTITRAEIQDALWRDKALVRTWAMRGTIHLLPADLLPEWTAALGQREMWRRPAWLKWFGVTLEEMESLIAAMPDLLTAEPRTRIELADALEARLGRQLRDVLLSSWGSFLKIPANRGDLAFGPDRGRNVTFVRPDAWLPVWRAADPAAAIDAMILRYIRAYGPSTPDAIRQWWGVAAVHIRPALKRLQDRLVTVAFGEHRGLFPREHLVELERAEPPKGVRLLGGFDVLVIAGYPRSLFIPAGFESRVSRTAGWISPVLLIDGIVRATWEPRRRRDEVVVEVAPFGALPRTIERTLAPELDRLSRFLGAPVRVEVQDRS